MRSGRIHINLMTRFLTFILVFFLAIILQMAISYFQSTRVIRPLSDSVSEVQSLSDFLNRADMSLRRLEDFRWEYGEAEKLMSGLRGDIAVMDAAIADSHIGKGAVSDEQRRLVDSVRVTFGSYKNLLGRLNDFLILGDSASASALFYQDIEACGTYLSQYTQSLIAVVLEDNQESHATLLALTGRLQLIQSVINVVCVLSGIIFIFSIIRLVSSVVEMSKSATRISEGHFDIPDVSEGGGDEIASMAKAFNEMKHSLSAQVRLLEEKNEMERALHQREKEALELENHLETEKLQRLRSQINPHFLFNTLGVVKNKSHEEAALETEALIGSLSKLFRYSLQDNENETYLSREIKIVNEFYSLYRERFGERMTLKWVCSPLVDLTTVVVPSFIIQPLVENSFKHGLGPKEGSGVVTVFIFPEEEYLRITVEDDGVGIPQEKLEKIESMLKSGEEGGDGHIGLYNVATRLRLLSDNSSFEIKSQEGGGTSISMRMKLVVNEGGET